MTVDEFIVDQLKASIRSPGLSDNDELRCALNGLYDKSPLRTEQLLIGLLKGAVDAKIPHRLASLSPRKAASQLATFGASLASATGADHVACQRAATLWAVALGKFQLSAVNRTRILLGNSASKRTTMKQIAKCFVAGTALVTAFVLGMMAVDVVGPSSQSSSGAFIELHSDSGDVTPAPKRDGANKVFGEDGSLPHQIMTLQESIVSLQAIQAGEVGLRLEVERLNDRLNDTLKAQSDRIVRARLSVLEVTATHVHLLPDVTWGWPTNDIIAFAVGNGEAHKAILPRFNVVLLKEQSSSEVPKQLSLAIGEDVPVEIAKHLMWNDKINVEFVCMSAARVQADNALKARFILTISNLKFLSLSESWKWRQLDLHRTYEFDVWPQGETLPSRVYAFAPIWWIGNLHSREWNFQSFVEYASRTLQRGKARLAVRNVVAGLIVLDGRIAVRDNEFPEVTLIPLDGNRYLEVAAGDLSSSVRPGEKLLVSFDVKEVTGGLVNGDRAALWVRVQNLQAMSPGDSRVARNDISDLRASAPPRIAYRAAYRSALAPESSRKIAHENVPHLPRTQAIDETAISSSTENIIEFHLPSHGNDPIRTTITGTVGVGSIVTANSGGKRVTLRIVRPITAVVGPPGAKRWLAVSIPAPVPEARSH